MATPEPRRRPRGFRAQRSWLRDHAHEYPGCWLAVLDDTLVSANPAIGSVLEAIWYHPSAGDALLHYEPAGIE